MARIHSLGFPRIGRKRELKFQLESYWQGQSTRSELESLAQTLRAEAWTAQQECDLVPVGDFSFYDHVLDTSVLLGHWPDRIDAGKDTLDNYFRVARGRAQTGDCQCTHAGEMTKWFDTNYHYIVPEVTAETRFSLNPERLLNQLSEAQTQGVRAKPVIIGPVTYLWLAKTKDESDRLALLERLLPVYAELLNQLAERGVEWVQIDEPILVTELTSQWRYALEQAYHHLKVAPVKLLLTSYFGELQDNLQLACQLPVAGLHLDAISAPDEVTKLVDWLPVHKVLSLGVISGRNIWKTHLNHTLDWLEPIASRLGDRLWLAPSCSLLHVPVDLSLEDTLDQDIRRWLAFAVQKLDELQVLKTALNEGRAAVAETLADNQAAIELRRTSPRVINPRVRKAVAETTAAWGTRQSEYAERAKHQRAILQLPDFPTTTIGSFPQTAEIRQARQAFKQGTLSEDDYRQQMEAEIRRSVTEQEALGLDVLVHGEAERNDMVEYFGEQLEGYVFSRFGWVQSYGSRCVKPPILFGDIHRPTAMTVSWIKYAQSLTNKPMKGMLTGPVTMLNWSFVRDDQPREATCRQLALAIREEVLDLEQAGIQVIQIDEAALREGLPLRQSQWQDYLDWAVACFRLCANGVSDETQIHTHMCYSEFNDIMPAIARMDADVITIETSRSDMELLDAFDAFDYPNEIGPGVYDIHSPNIPSERQIIDLMEKAQLRIPRERLWVNPDCGLKTRQWEEVRPALKNLVAAARCLRDERIDLAAAASENSLLAEALL